MFAYAVVCLAGAIGAATAVFAIVNGAATVFSARATVALLSSFITARTAARIDPLVAPRD
jgi:hypothetical protein